MNHPNCVTAILSTFTFHQSQPYLFSANSFYRINSNTWWINCYCNICHHIVCTLKSGFWSMYSTMSVCHLIMNIHSGMEGRKPIFDYFADDLRHTLRLKIWSWKTTTCVDIQASLYIVFSSLSVICPKKEIKVWALLYTLSLVLWLYFLIILDIV